MHEPPAAKVPPVLFAVICPSLPLAALVELYPIPDVTWEPAVAPTLPDVIFEAYSRLSHSSERPHSVVRLLAVFALAGPSVLAVAHDAVESPALSTRKVRL